MERLTGQSLSERLLNGMKTKGDVTFFVGKEPGKEFKASIFILSISSPVFDSMFNHQTENNQIQNNNIIRLPEVPSDTFSHFLKLLVTDNVKVSDIQDLELSIEEIFHLLHLVKKYEIDFIYSICLDYIKLHMRNNICDIALIYEYSRCSTEFEIAEEAFNIFCRNAADVCNSDGFLKLSKESLKIILKNDELAVRELFLFKRVYRWAEAQCVQQQLEVSGKNIRQILGHLLFLVRFPLILPWDFAQFVRPTNILTAEETIGIYDYFATPLSERDNYNSRRMPFDHHQRIWKAKEEREFSTPTNQRLRPRSRLLSSPSLTWLFKGA